MDWLERMNRALDYIEENLSDSIDMKQAASLACCSPYHFQRMFSFITGVPLAEYIRRRRLSLAASLLQTTHEKVIDLAFRMGYESSEAFSRAFHRLHGVSPTAARQKGIQLKAYPRLSFHITIKGDSEMNYRIEEKDAFEIFGLELDTNVIDGRCFREISAFWEQSEKNGALKALADAAGKNPKELLDAGVTYGHNPNGEMRYMIGCLRKPGMDTDGYAVLRIPAGTWAVFPVDWKKESDDRNLHECWQRIYSEWFPSMPYEHSDSDYDLELYFGTRDADCGVEIFIPVMKSKL